MPSLITGHAYLRLTYGGLRATPKVSWRGSSDATPTKYHRFCTHRRNAYLHDLSGDGLTRSDLSKNGLDGTSFINDLNVRQAEFVFCVR